MYERPTETPKNIEIYENGHVGFESKSRSIFTMGKTLNHAACTKIMDRVANLLALDNSSLQFPAVRRCKVVPRWVPLQEQLRSVNHMVPRLIFYYYTFMTLSDY